MMSLRWASAALLGAGLSLAWSTSVVEGQAGREASHSQSSVQGLWRIIKVLPTRNVACWDAERAKTLLGTTLQYEPGRMVWHDGAVKVTGVTRRTVSRKKFLDDYRVDLTELGIMGTAVQEIDLQHEDADVTGGTTEVPGDTVLLAGPGRIVVSACGVYYAAVKVMGRS